MLRIDLTPEEKKKIMKTQLSKEEKAEAGELFCAMVISLLLYPLIIALNAFVGFKMWVWLLVPTSELYEWGIPAISYSSSLCLFFVIGFFCKKEHIGNIYLQEIDRKKVWINVLLFSWLRPLMMLIIAFAVKIIVY